MDFEDDLISFSTSAVVKGLSQPLVGLSFPVLVMGATEFSFFEPFTHENSKRLLRDFRLLLLLRLEDLFLDRRDPLESSTLFTESSLNELFGVANTDGGLWTSAA